MTKPLITPRITRVTEGEFAGWWRTQPSGFLGQVGPFYSRREADGTIRSAFRAEERHMNGQGRMHGGCLATFADFSMFAITATQFKDVNAVTATMSLDYLGAALPGDLIESTGEVVKNGRSLVVLRGIVTTGERKLLAFSGTFMPLHKTKAGA